MPETRFEVIDGKVAYVSPSDEPHGSRHSKVSALLEAHVKDGWDVACDMLTRAAKKDDFAPDASVFPSARDRATGGRRLEELAFEVVSTERLNAAGQKAATLVARGVRRVFAIDVKRKRALEWSVDTSAWTILGRSEAIADEALVVPLPVSALVEAAKSDDAVAAALLAKKNPVLVRALDAGRAEGEAEGRAEGEAEGRAEGEARGRVKALADAVLAVLRARGLDLQPPDVARLRRIRDANRLLAGLKVASTCKAADQVLLAVRRPPRRSD